MYDITKGMQCLHAKNIIYKDLTAINILFRDTTMYREEGSNLILDIGLDKENCIVVDFEPCVRVVGTKFWRALKILFNIKNGELKSKLFIKQLDVYSFEMTRYEILSNCILFQGLHTSN